MELLVLGMLIGAGAARRKSVTKAFAKGYLALAETSGHLKQDLHEAISEARAEQELDIANEPIGVGASDIEVAALHEEADGDHHDEETTQTSLSEITGLTASKPGVRHGLNGDGLHPHASQNESVSEEHSVKEHQEPLETEHRKATVSMLKGMAKGFLRVADITRGAAARVREDMKDAVEEAKYEREVALTRKVAQEIVEAAETAKEAVVVEESQSEPTTEDTTGFAIIATLSDRKPKSKRRSSKPKLQDAEESPVGAKRSPKVVETVQPRSRRKAAVAPIAAPEPEPVVSASAN